MKQIYLSLFFGLGLLFACSAANAQDDGYEIWEHVPSVYKVFKSGGSIFLPYDQVHKGSAIGKDCGQYVIPHDNADEIMDWARNINQDGSVCYDIAEIEKSLGINDGAWDGKILIRVNMRSEALHELHAHWPRESDCVPYEGWLDGVTRCCGIPIAMVGRIPSDYIVIIDKEIKPCKHTSPGIPVPYWLPIPCSIPHCCGCIPFNFPPKEVK